jgi:hypothetical protein
MSVTVANGSSPHRVSREKVIQAVVIRRAQRLLGHAVHRHHGPIERLQRLANLAGEPVQVAQAEDNQS